MNDPQTIARNLSGLRDALASAVTRACAGLADTREFSAYEMRQSFEDTWALSAREDCCYDRPSIGLNYALWYQARRVHDVIRAMVPVWTDHQPELLVDLGAGTGATSWALAVAATAGVRMHDPQVVEVEPSPPMAWAAEQLWDQLQRDACFGPAARRIRVQRVCANWSQPRINAAGADVVASYLFDHSDADRTDEVGTAFGRMLDGIGAQRIHLLTTLGKRATMVPLKEALEDRDGWRGSFVAGSPAVWRGGLPDLVALRRRLLGECGVHANQLTRPPTFDNGQAGVLSLRMERPNTIRSPRRAPTFVLDDQQDDISQPRPSLTMVMGPAGSGKSRVLVERLARTMADAPPGSTALVTAFNRDLVTQLWRWTWDRLEDDIGGWESVGLGSGDHTLQTTNTLMEPRTIRLLNWDRVVTDRGLFAARSLQGQAGSVSDRIAERADLIDRQMGSLVGDARRVLQPDFLLAEAHRVMWGLGLSTHGRYLAGKRVGREVGLGPRQRTIVWEILMGKGHVDTFSHVRMRTPRTSRMVFDHLFIDECQDFTPSDFTLAAGLVEDARAIVSVGDSSQAMHLGPAYRRPPQLSGTDGQTRNWGKPLVLAGTYRLPLRIAEAVRPVAEMLGMDRDSMLRDSQTADLLDTGDLNGVSSAHLGMRPVVIAASPEPGQQMDQLAQVLMTYAPLLSGLDQRLRRITMAEGDGFATYKDLKARCPEGARAEVASMRKIKGLERPVVIWPAAVPLPVDESEEEWAYTVLTRPTSLLVILLGEHMAPAVERVVARLRPDRLMPWTHEADRQLNTIRHRATAAWPG